MTPDERPVSALRSPLVVVAGPTASGKSSLALALALRFGGEIISCDSVAVYREFEIGTAKPSCQERARVPHHLIDVVAPGRLFHRRSTTRGWRAPPPVEITARGHLPDCLRRHRPLPARHARRSICRARARRIAARTAAPPQSPRLALASAAPPRSRSRRPHPRQR